MEKSDHISLTLSAITVGASEESSAIPARKSLRRSWNQLPRCQRNLIIFGVLAICITFLLFLPGDQIISQNGKQLVERNVFRFRGNREDRETVDILPAEKSNLKRSADLELSSDDKLANANSGADEESEVNVNVGQDINRDTNDIPNKRDVILSKKVLEATEQTNNENMIKLPEKLNPDDVNFFMKDTSINKINIEEIDVNNIEAPAPAPPQAKDFINPNGPFVEPVVHDALKTPDVGNEIIEHLLLKAEAEKQHFHGATNERQEAIVSAFKYSWNGYKKYAWGHDNLKPLSQTSHDWFGLGLTIVDSLDTMYIMGLEDEFAEARDWVNESLTFEVNRDVNLFEVTIRVLGGLLSAYHLSGDKMFLQKSIELGNRLLPCFQSPSGIPYSDVNLASRSAHSPKWSPDSSTSEVTTIQLEFRDLSRSINIPMYEKAVNTVNEKVHALEKKDGLVPIFINANTGTFRNYATISLGARGDSYYEYLLKQWLQTGRKENDYLILDYMRAIDGVITHLKRSTPKEQHVYIGELINGKEFKPKMDHLTCYLPGTLLLGHVNGMPESHLQLGKDLLETCFQTYMKQPTQLAPEISYFAVNENDEHDIIVKPNDSHNLLRPEFIESLYYFYALTGNRTYQDMGWIIFQAFEKHTKVASGYTSIGNVKNIFNTRLRDMMESFWLSETLKYFYLLFSSNRKEIDLEKWVFNSEAHPLPIRNH